MIRRRRAADVTLHGVAIYKCQNLLTYLPVTTAVKRPAQSTCHIMLVTASSELRKVLFLAPSVCVFLFVYEIFREPLNGLAPNSHGRRV